jgi:hypothetical protein
MPAIATAFASVVGSGSESGEDTSDDVSINECVGDWRLLEAWDSTCVEVTNVA